MDSFLRMHIACLLTSQVSIAYIVRFIHMFTSKQNTLTLVRGKNNSTHLHPPTLHHLRHPKPSSGVLRQAVLVLAFADEEEY